MNLALVPTNWDWLFSILLHPLFAISLQIFRSCNLSFFLVVLLLPSPPFDIFNNFLASSSPHFSLRRLFPLLLFGSPPSIFSTTNFPYYIVFFYYQFSTNVISASHSFNCNLIVLFNRLCRTLEFGNEIEFYNLSLTSPFTVYPGILGAYCDTSKHWLRKAFQPHYLEMNWSRSNVLFQISWIRVLKELIT